MQQQHRAEVVPLRSLPPQLSAFSYEVPAELAKIVAPGSVVTIPFKQQMIFGIVESVTLKKSSQTKLKRILSVTDIVMTHKQRTLATHLSHLYFQSRASIYKSFLAPPPQKKRSEPDQQQVINHMLQQQVIKKTITQGYLFYDSYNAIISYCNTLAKTWSGQCVIVAPEIKHRSMIQQALHAAGCKRVLLLPAKQSKNAFYNAWKESATAPIIIGSMTALFLPFSNLTNIIIFEAENILFKKAEQNPRYHLADFVYDIAELYHAKVLFTGFSPDITLLQSVHKKKLPIVRLGQPRPCAVIDMNQERASGGTGFISAALADALKNSDEPALLVFNRLADAHMLVCRSCGFVATCPQCTQPLSFNRNNNDMSCISCETKSAIYSLCPRCSSDHLGEKGTSVATVTRELKKLLPKKNITEFSSKRWTAKPLRTHDVILATNKIFSHFEYSFDVAAYVNADQDLLIPNVYSAEMLRHHILKLAARARRVYLQTYAPHHYLFSTLDDVRAFYDHELSNRKTFHYPPTSRVLKLTVADKTEEAYGKKRKELMARLKQYPIFGPFEKRTHSRYSATLIIKTDLKDSTIDDILTDSYNLCTIEINPYDILS